MIELRDYQQEIADKACEILTRTNWCYLAMEVRTGKTLTSLSIADNIYGVDNVLFLTKKKAISSITDDSDKLCPSYALFIINYESIHKLPPVSWDVIIVDEAHTLGAFPKPSKRAKQVRDLIRNHSPYVILMSGTPTPESFSQMYHQVYGIPRNPFAKYANFYKFAADYVDVRQRKVNSFMVNDYSRGDASILDAVRYNTIHYTQADAGFVNEINEKVLLVDLDETTYQMCKKLKNDKVIEGKKEVVLADTPVKLMQKLHQMYSGTVKFESGSSMVLDYSKADFIRSHFKGQKIGIFYKFVAELEALKKVFGDDLTTELSVFEDTSKSIALQIVSGREGISLRQADALVYYNIDFSATSYWQSRDRMTTKERTSSDVYWVFSRGGIEHAIYNAVKAKKDYTLRHFKRDVLSL
jgi:hypothetical protein